MDEGISTGHGDAPTEVRAELTSLAAQLEAASEQGSPLQLLRGFGKALPATRGQLAAVTIQRTLASKAADAAPLRTVTEAFRDVMPGHRLTGAVSVIGRAQVRSALDGGLLADASGVHRVADQMAALAAAALGGHLAQLATEDQPALVPWSSPMARHIRAWTEERAAALTQLFRGVGKQIDEAEEHLPQLVLATGWVIPVVHERPAFLAKLTALNQRTPGGARRELLAIYHPSGARFARVAQGLRTADGLSRHRRALEQGLSALRRRHYYAAICTLLPLVEAALHAAEWTAVPDREPKTIRQAWNAVRGPREALWLTLIDVVLRGGKQSGYALSKHFVREQVATSAAHNQALERNAILHGASSAYGTRENAVRLVLLLAAIVEIRPAPSP